MEIYKRRWATRVPYKQLKQNFPLHFFYGDSVNAIQIQTWVVLIAKSALYRYLQNDKKTRILLAAGNHAEAHTDVLH